MGAATIFERVKNVVAERLDVEESKVTMEALFIDDLGADSLDLVELMMSIEDEFKVDGKPMEIPDKDAEKLTTVGDVVNYLKNQGFKD